MSIFETSRNKLIDEGLIKDNVTDWCHKGLCNICTMDGMCTKKDIKSGKIRHTFIDRYKKEHRVMK